MPVSVEFRYVVIEGVSETADCVCNPAAAISCLKDRFPDCVAQACSFLQIETFGNVSCNGDGPANAGLKALPLPPPWAPARCDGGNVGVV